MKSVMLSIVIAALLVGCHSTPQKATPVVEKEQLPVVHSRNHCEPVGGPTSNKCR